MVPIAAIQLKKLNPSRLCLSVITFLDFTDLLRIDCRRGQAPIEVAPADSLSQAPAGLLLSRRNTDPRQVLGCVKQPCCNAV
jgi:hypothetical protein